MNKDPLVFIGHILISVANIENFMEGISKPLFMKNTEKQSAVVRQIEIIGEAVKNLPIEFTTEFPDIPWKKIAGMRDKLMHHYFGVNLDTVWGVVREDIPSLKQQILAVKSILEKKANIKANNKSQ